MSEYTSIKDHVLTLLANHLPEMQSRFGIDVLGIFGSVSRGEDTTDSDVDILYTFQEGRGGLYDYGGVVLYLEELLGREIDFVSLEFLNPHLKPYVEPDIILVTNPAAMA